MPLWSLTQERVDKLRRQIGDVEMEVDLLIKLTKEDLWRRDLDLFIEEWRAQLDNEHKRKRRINNMGRRTSKKVTVAGSDPTTKKRKGLGDRDDDDFEDRPRAKKPALPKVKKTEIIVEKKEPLLKTWLSGNGTQGKNPARYHDGNSSEVEQESEVAGVKLAQAKKSKPATKARTVPVPDNPEDEEVVTRPAGRKARAAASKPIHYDGGSDSDDSNGDDLLGDITKMVKGLPGGIDISSADPKPLLQTSRATTNGTASLKVPGPVPTKSYAEISEDDDTNFLGLVPQQSPRRSIHVTKNVELTDNEDEDEPRPLTTNKARSQSTKPSKRAAKEKPKAVVRSDSEADQDNDSDDIISKPKSRPTQTKKTTSKPSKPAAKPAATKRNPAPKKSKPKAASTTAPVKKAPLSPAAKAYAAKQAKSVNRKNRLLDSDEEEDAIEAMADDLLDSPTVGPGAVAAKDNSDIENRPPVMLKKATAAATTTSGVGGRARPARRAAAEAATKKKPIYVISDEEDEEDDDNSGDGADLGGGGNNGNDDSEDDFDDSF